MVQDFEEVREDLREDRLVEVPWSSCGRDRAGDVTSDSDDALLRVFRGEGVEHVAEDGGLCGVVVVIVGEHTATELDGHIVEKLFAFQD